MEELKISLGTIKTNIVTCRNLSFLQDIKYLKIPVPVPMSRAVLYPDLTALSIANLQITQENQILKNV